MAKDIYAEVSAKILSLMETHGERWIKPWSASAASSWPVNVKTGSRYNGINVIMLCATSADKGYGVNIWGTYKQWQEKGAQVRKGEKGTMGILWKTFEKEQTKPDGSTEKKVIPMMRGFTLFNVSQVDGYDMPEPEKREIPTVEQAEAWIANTGAAIEFGGDRACYIPSVDRIQLPVREAFRDTASFYSVAFHELAHWTGNRNRLDRLRMGRFGDENYALEELVAELSAAFQCAVTGVTMEPRPDHAAYLKSWMRKIKDDSKAFGQAVKAARVATDYIHELQS